MQHFDDLKQALEEKQQQAILAIRDTHELAVLEQLRINYLGKKSELTEVLKSLGQLPPTERPLMGQILNEVKQTILEHLMLQKKQLEKEALHTEIEKNRLDVTLPGRNTQKGSRHPVQKTRHRVEAFFAQMGFEIVDGPEVESEYYNFETLNIPAHHPARAMHDTFYCEDHWLLRTHTSPVQIRAMEQRTAPVRLIAPGRVYRCDSDLTHTPMFHQVEGLFIDEQANFANLKATLNAFFTFFLKGIFLYVFAPLIFLSPSLLLR